MELKTLRLGDADNVVVAITPLEAGTIVEGSIPTGSNIPAGHKIAVAPIEEGAPILKYGQIIGVASRKIAAGDHVHLHNVEMSDRRTDIHGLTHEAPIRSSGTRTFLGYDRSEGRIGTRNYIGIVTTVNCSSTVARMVADQLNADPELNAVEDFDGVVALTHGGGCAVNTSSEGYLYLQRTLAGYARHPNFAAVLLLGLGCETNQVDHIMERWALRDKANVRAMTIQDEGGTRSTVERAKEAVKSLVASFCNVPRTEVPVSGIKLALECGGSDGYSGVSANPALGYASDLLVAHGGTSCLAETPEIFGAEHLLTARAPNAEVAKKLLSRIEWWRDYTHRHGAELNNNPSFGNKKGGLTTILEKSMGAVAKGGTMPLSAVYEYSEEIAASGLVFMDTPGYDPVAVTGQIAGGCNVICFTTGRGSVSGFKPVPCIKIATNDTLFSRMSDDMDINAGSIVTGLESIEEVGERIFERIVAVASGERTLSEMHGFGDNEFVPWQLGAVT